MAVKITDATNEMVSGKSQFFSLRTPSTDPLVDWLHNTSVSISGNKQINLPLKSPFDSSDIFSVSALIRVGDARGITKILSQNGTFELSQKENGDFRFRIWDQGKNGGFVDIPAGIIPANKWHLITATEDGATLSVFADGVRVGSSVASTSLALDTMVHTPIVVGDANANISWPGEIKNITLWNRPLAPDEVVKLFLQEHNTPPTILNITGEQKTDDGYVDVNYSAQDPEQTYISLAGYEYSLTGAFSGEEKPMAPADADQSHSGSATLTASASGTAHTFVWNAAKDLGDAFAGKVVVRLKPTDGIDVGAGAMSLPFSVDVKKPIISTLSAEELTGTTTVAIHYRLTDDTSHAISISAAISVDDGNTWRPLSAQLEAESGAKTISWDAGKDWGGHDGTVRIRITATDGFGNSGEAVSDPIRVDTKAPFGLSDVKGVAGDKNSILWSWSPVVYESNFDHYEL